MMEKENKINREELSEKKQNNYVKYFIFGMAIILAVILVFAFKPKEKTKFEYLGMEFERVMFDKIPLYRTIIPRTNLITGEVIANYEFFLRNDPRKLEFVPISGRIRLTKDIIVALDKSVTDANCVNATLAALNMGQFMNAAGIKALRGTTNLTESEDEDLIYASCSMSDNISVLITEVGNKTEIVQEDVNCYKIKVNNCQVIEATERFLIGTIAHSRGNFIG